MKKTLLLLSFLLSIVLNMNAQDAKKFTTYIVKEGETLKSIAKKIGCRTKEIKNLNPDIGKKLSTNITLVVPNKNFGKKRDKKKKKKQVEKKTSKKPIVHKVKNGNTLYSIAKEYNVPMQAILDINPGIKEYGLKAGQKIRIPFKEEFTNKVTRFDKVAFYTVKKGDTKWSIAKKHDIDVRDLERLNPDHEGELKVDEKIWIPANIVDDEEVQMTQKEKDSTFLYHRVKQGEGLFRIAVMYGTTQLEIENLNPDATKKLRPGMLLKIPGKKKDKFLVHTVAKDDNIFRLTRTYNVSETDLYRLNPELKEGLKLGMKLNIKPIETSMFQLDMGLMRDSISLGKEVNLSFLLPLMVDGTISTSSNSKQNKLRSICTDFFMGAEIALDSLKQKGLDVNYHVYDTKNSVSQLHSLLQQSDIQDSDVIIGPFFFNNAQAIADKLENTAIFTPLFSKKQLNDNHKNIVKSSVPKQETTNALIRHLLKEYSNQKVIIISDTDKSNILKAQEIGNKLKQHDSLSNIVYIKPSENKKDATQIYMDNEKLHKSVSEKEKAWVILISDNKIVSSDVVNTYGSMTYNKMIKLYTTKEFTDFTHLDYGHLSRLEWTFPSVEFDQLSTTQVSQFNKVYFKKNHTYPSSFSFSGFDLTYDALIRTSSSESYTEGLEKGVSERLAHRYSYSKSMGEDYKNHGVLLILFKEMEYHLLK